MFVRYYVELPLPKEVAAHALTAHPERWVPALASVSDLKGERLLADVGFPVDGHYRVGKRVAIELGEPVATGQRTWIPLTWRATGAQGLFPALEGELEVAALGPKLTQLGLSARYRPPFGVLGASLDRALLHRVAEATIRDFVERVADTLNRNARLSSLADSNGPLVLTT